jgi:hypothetical protein
MIAAFAFGVIVGVAATIVIAVLQMARDVHKDRDK